MTQQDSGLRAAREDAGPIREALAYALRGHLCYSSVDPNDKANVVVHLGPSVRACRTGTAR